MPESANETKDSLQGRVALITGAAKRIGRAVAMRLATEGADIVIHYNRSKSEADDAVAEITKLGRKSVAVQADLCSLVQIKRLFQQTAEQFGRLDILINSAANFLPAHLDDTTEKMWDTALDTNLKAPFFCAQAAAPLLKQSRGVIINFADVGGILPWPGYIPHCASKAGVIMLTKCLGKALAPEVRVNAVAPCTITMSGDPSEWEADFIRHAPLHRTGTPEDVADAVSFLIQAKFMTGQVLILDGGRTL
ncbi:MAG TPA: SDR family oxidoreductase [Candidatus Binatia bacterium]|nr:SDR family oxidoreductase [Candidatus Binatia bacterium]